MLLCHHQLVSCEFLNTKCVEWYLIAATATSEEASPAQSVAGGNEKVLSLVHALTCEWSQRLRGSCNLNKLLQLFQNAKRWWTCFAWRCRVRCDQINGTVQLASLLSIISVVGCVQALTANWSTYFSLCCTSRGSEINELTYVFSLPRCEYLSYWHSIMSW